MVAITNLGSVYVGLILSIGPARSLDGDLCDGDGMVIHVDLALDGNTAASDLYFEVEA